jgi:hypothetical protein
MNEHENFVVVSRDLFLRRIIAPWKRDIGAVGKANMQTGKDGAEARAEILRLPEIKLSSLKLRQVGMLGIALQAAPGCEMNCNPDVHYTV